MINPKSMSSYGKVPKVRLDFNHQAVGLVRWWGVSRCPSYMKIMDNLEGPVNKEYLSFLVVKIFNKGNLRCHFKVGACSMSNDEIKTKEKGGTKGRAWGEKREKE